MFKTNNANGEHWIKDLTKDYPFTESDLQSYDNIPFSEFSPLAQHGSKFSEAMTDLWQNRYLMQY